MSQQPEALQLAQMLDAYSPGTLGAEAAAELRRLHSVNAQLLEALEGITSWCQGYEAGVLNPMAARYIDAARAAIAAAKEVA